MAFKFFAQKIFDSSQSCVGVELLVRSIPYGDDCIRSPYDIMSHPDFSDSDLFSIDMQILTFLDVFSTQFKEANIDYVFINLSDQILKMMILGDDSSAAFINLKSIARALSPLTLVAEINELSRIRKEHSSLILKRLQSIGFMVAQDDYTPSRREFLSIDWDFIKLDFDSCCEADIPEHPQIIIERSEPVAFSKYQGSTLHQGFSFHVPSELQKVLLELKKGSTKIASTADAGFVRGKTHQEPIPLKIFKQI